MTHFWGKILVEYFREKINIYSREILSNFCSVHFLSNLNPIWEKRVWEIKFCTFCPINLNQYCTTKVGKTTDEKAAVEKNNLEKLLTE